MDDMRSFCSGQRVSFVDPKGRKFTGIVDTQRRGWVMVDLDEPHDTGVGWRASKMMFRSGELVPTD